MFTGSTATGRTVAGQAGERLIGISAELGGKNAMVVTDDVDLDRAVEGAVVGCFANTGQLCISIERIYVARRRSPRTFTDAFGARTAELTPRRRAGLRPRGRRAGLAGPARQGHASTSTTPWPRAPAWWPAARPAPTSARCFYEPTVLADVTPDMALYREETFGPVVAVYPVAVRSTRPSSQVNDTEYGLNASVYCGDTGRGRRRSPSASGRHGQRQRRLLVGAGPASTPRWAA